MTPECKAQADAAFKLINDWRDTRCRPGINFGITLPKTPEARHKHTHAYCSCVPRNSDSEVDTFWTWWPHGVLTGIPTDVDELVPAVLLWTQVFVLANKWLMGGELFYDDTDDCVQWLFGTKPIWSWHPFRGFTSHDNLYAPLDIFKGGKQLSFMMYFWAEHYIAHRRSEPPVRTIDRTFHD